MSILKLVIDQFPEIGVVAPCTVNVYQKKGSNQMEVSFFNYETLVQSFGFNDKKVIDFLNQTSSDIVNVIKASHAKAK
jgi:uncharacterized protein (DUF302 family)